MHCTSALTIMCRHNDTLREMLVLRIPLEYNRSGSAALAQAIPQRLLELYLMYSFLERQLRRLKNSPSPDLFPSPDEVESPRPFQPSSAEALKKPTKRFVCDQYLHSQIGPELNLNTETPMYRHIFLRVAHKRPETLTFWPSHTEGTIPCVFLRIFNNIFARIVFSAPPH